MFSTFQVPNLFKFAIAKQVTPLLFYIPDLFWETTGELGEINDTPAKQNDVTTVCFFIVGSVTKKINSHCISISIYNISDWYLFKFFWKCWETTYWIGGRKWYAGWRQWFHKGMLFYSRWYSRWYSVIKNFNSHCISISIFVYNLRQELMTN